MGYFSAKSCITLEWCNGNSIGLGARRLGFQQMGKGSLKVEYCNSPFSPSKGYWLPCGQGITTGSPCYVVKHCHPFKSFEVHRRSVYVRQGESKWSSSILRPLFQSLELTSFIRNVLGLPWWSSCIRLYPSTAEGTGLIPGQERTVLHAGLQSQKRGK